MPIITIFQKRPPWTWDFFSGCGVHFFSESCFSVLLLHELRKKIMNSRLFCGSFFCFCFQALFLNIFFVVIISWNYLRAPLFTPNNSSTWTRGFCSGSAFDFVFFQAPVFNIFVSRFPEHRCGPRSSLRKNSWTPDSFWAPLLMLFPGPGFQ